MTSFEVRAVIDAAPEVIWSVLTDAAGHADWNDTVERIDGEIAEGARITVHARVGGGRAFPVTVATLEPPNRMVWRGGLPLGLFTGVRTFSLSGSAAGGTEFIMREVFSGPLAALFGSRIPDLGPSFSSFAACLKRAAETQARR